jgi:hypothetical protein
MVTDEGIGILRILKIKVHTLGPASIERCTIFSKGRGAVVIYGFNGTIARMPSISQDLVCRSVVLSLRTTDFTYRRFCAPEKGERNQIDPYTRGHQLFERIDHETAPLNFNN